MRVLAGGLLVVLGCVQPTVEVDSGHVDSGPLDSGPLDSATRDATLDANDAGGDARMDSGPPRCLIPVADQLDADAMEAHLVAFADVAALHGGDRAAGESGYSASVDYVVERIRALGYEPERQRFEHTRFAQVSEPELVLTIDGVDEALAAPAYQVSFRSGGGRAEGAAVAVGHDTAGCGACDFDAWDAFTGGGVAWVREEVDDLAEVAFVANLRGVAALLVEVDEEAPERVWNPRGPVASGMPILLVGHSVGERLARTESVLVSVDLDPGHVVESENVIVELPGAEPGVVMIGAHLDSVLGGPGINDNGTGVAATLELLAALGNCSLQQSVRFAFWGSEEWGLWGSRHWVESAGDQIDDVEGYLNFDMIGSTNGGLYLLGEREPGTLGAQLAAHFDARGVAWRWDEALSDRSDHAFFREAGIPIAGVFAGAEVLVSEDAAAAFGTEAGMPHDLCYHRPCDTLENVDRTRMLTAARGLAALAQALAAP